ncbi:uncharacterized protein [Rutidosis leptorrhynchoides]|uniref:uncharacterized protein isoform X2 n=1 Tax=Rutidosis leptorrhynchoides TaxID=125765 RepID=UPI003A9A2F76
MEALLLMDSASSLKLLGQHNNNNNKFLSFKHHDFFTKLSLHHSFCYYYYNNNNNHNNKDVHFNLSISVSSTRRGVRPVYLSSSHTQLEIDKHELLIQESPNGHTNAQTVGVKFQLQRECSFGQNFLLTGDDPVLGLWDPNNAIPLTWSDGHLWTVHLDIPIEKCIKFKFIMQVSDGIFEWQPGPDRVLECFKTHKIITVCEDWEDPDLRTTIETEITRPVDEDNETSGVVNQDLPAESLVCDCVNGYETNMLESDEEGVSAVLVPGLSQYQDESVNELVPAHVELDESVNEAAALVSTGGADVAVDLKIKMTELDLKEDANTTNSNPRPEISSIYENQDSYENKDQDMQQVAAEEQDDKATQAMKCLHHNDNHWGNNLMKRLLNMFGVQ